ncbi:unnamed protein product [Ambrosiozyma monospora]|uniref:Unnamed protein product n=1 Tax=Ambrosiozyma monospora TaxID=43982 RepID=A0A9W6YXG3_AMBMO|nr:unnamed protein product [Ambrosiozyma monospora]
MKFAKLFQQVLEEEEVPDDWVQRAVQYKALKKRINKVVDELESIGLAKENMSLDYDIKRIERELHPVLNLSVSPLMKKVIIDKLRELKYSYDITTLGTPENEPKLVELQSNNDTSSCLSAADPFDDSPFYLIKVYTHEDLKFFQTLYDELEGLGVFKQEQEVIIKNNVENLASVISHVASPNAKRSDMYAWREIFQLYIDTQIFFSTQEHSAGERNIQQSREKFLIFMSRVESSKALRRFKHKESVKLFAEFKQLNEQLLKVSTFQIMNSMAVAKILKKFDKRTRLHSKAIFPEVIEKSQQVNILHGSVAKDMCAIIASRLLNIIPQIDDYTCPICCSVAFKPIRLDCGHLFCVRCLVKLQRKNEDRCPLCRQDVLLNADERNLDTAQMSYMKLYFPKEVKQKQTENEKEVFKEQYGTIVDPDAKCVIV